MYRYNNLLTSYGIECQEIGLTKGVLLYDRFKWEPSYFLSSVIMILLRTIAIGSSNDTHVRNSRCRMTHQIRIAPGRAENSWRMQRMLILNSAWPFSPMRSTSSRHACTWISGHTHEFRFLCGETSCVCIGGNQHRFYRRRVRQFGTRTSVAVTGWLLKPEGWDIGYLGNPEGRPFHPPGGISRRSTA